jgi:multiple sugar transport system ATP-binding protein
VARVTLDGVRKVYDDARQSVAVDRMDLDVADGEFVVLVGPSGCGKTTTLRMIAGLESISAGQLSIDGRVVNDVPPKDRDIAMVFQSYALYPHMSVRENMAFALTLRKLPRAEIDARVKHAADILGLDDLLARRPGQLSGGQRQRVAIGRAIVRQPRVFLFDEPLSNLDASLRLQTRREIAKLHHDLHATMIYVTHDQVEAMTMGDRIVVMNAGRVQQIDTPRALYDRPRNTFVATFLGSPPMNLIPGRIADGAFRSATGVLTIPLTAPALGRYAGRSVTLGVRPEDVLPSDSSRATNRATANSVVEVVEPLGNEGLIHAHTADFDVTSRVAPLPPVNAVPAPGQPLALAFDADKVHYFDPETGDRIVVG